MSSSEAPSHGTFFVDQQPVAPAPAPAPVAAAPTEPTAPVQQAPQPSEPQVAPPVDLRGAMFDVPLGTLIFRAGLLAEEQLEDALQEGMRTGKRLGEVLVERGLIQEPELGRLLAGQKGLRFLELSSVSVDPAAVQLLPEESARMHHALAIGFEEGIPVVAVADPTNELVVENVRRALGSDPQFVVAAHGDLGQKIDQAYTAPAPAAPPVEPAPVAAPAPEPQAPVAQPAPPEAPAPAEQPMATPAPMPTVVPPPEERAPEAQPLVVAPPPPAPAEVPPLHAQAAAEPTPPVAPPVPEPVAAPAPAAPPATVAPVEQPVEPGLFTQAAEQAIAPLAAESPPETPAVPEVPEAPAAQQPVEEVEAPVVQQPEPATVPAAGSEPVTAPTHFVVLRLTGDDHVEIGGFASQDEAESFARTVVGRISRAEEQAEWPFFTGRFLRPQTIVSVDVVEQSVSTWTGSAMRTRAYSPSA